ncbi:MAG: hypothetical protein JXR05_17090 [Flavobacteriaceae bacterium]
MKLITKELLKRFEEVGSQIGSENPIIIAKFIPPLLDGVFYATDYDTDKKAFYGYFIDVEHKRYLNCFFTDKSLQVQVSSHCFSAKRDWDFKEIYLSELQNSLSCILKD